MDRDPMLIVAIIACLLVVVVLMLGLTAFVKGGAFNQKYANRMMQYRIIAQAVAVVVILFAVAAR